MKEYKLKINGKPYGVTIENVQNNIASVTVDGTPYRVELESAGAAPVSPGVAAPRPAEPAPRPAASAAAPANAQGSKTALKSPLPGVILDIKVAEGASVKAGQTVMILEAMKMENNIEADRDGIVRSIKARRGDPVLEGDVLLTIE